MTRTEARVPTENAGKYIQQLAKHWSHKLEVETNADGAAICFGEATVVMQAEPHAVHAVIEAADADAAARFQEVLEKHLDRFAFREAPLSYDWREAA